MKKSRILSLSLFFLLILNSVIVNAQVADTTGTAKLKSYIKNYIYFSKNYPQEKVYLHFDNTSYYLGESIWFKAYVVRADRNSLSQISKILYVDLISTEGYVLHTLKLKVENGQCHGEFKLSPSNYGGFYEVRAYTRYMSNFGKNNYYSRVFPVFDQPTQDGVYKTVITERVNSKQIPIEREMVDTLGRLNVSFYPEGGSLVAGVPSRVAFKAYGKEGENATITGAIIDKNGKMVSEVESGYLGMGLFEITPGLDAYTARVEYDNKKFNIKLPTVLPTGYVMTVDNSDSTEIAVQIQRNTKTVGQLLGLSIASRGLLYGIRTIDMKNDTVSIITIPNTMVPTGVSQLTLYNLEGKIESERLLFVNHNSALKFQVSTEDSALQPYGKVNINLGITDKQDAPVETTFSVSVRDAGTTPVQVSADNVLTNLLLSSDLKGFIEHPAYYFESNSPIRKKSLDLLMMTQGWRRYEWKQMAGVSTFKIKQWADKQLTIDGTASSLMQKKPVNNAWITMSLYNGDTSQSGTCTTDSAGVFNYALQDFYGDAKLILRSQKNPASKLSEMYLVLNRQFSPPIKGYSFAEKNSALELSFASSPGLSMTEKNDSVSFIPEGNDKLSMDKKQHLLKEVEVKANRTPIKVNLSYNVAKEMDKIIDTKDDWEPATLDQLLRKLNKYYATEFKGKKPVFVKTYTKLKSNVNALNSTQIGSPTATKSASTINPVSGVSTMSSTASAGETGSLQTQIEGQINQENISFDSNMSMPDIDEIESVSFIEDYNSIARIYPDGTANLSKIVVVLLQLKIPYVREPIGTRKTYFTGYSQVSDFFSPQYDRGGLPKEKDYRRTLYWNPNVKTGPDGKANIEFYNNGSCNAINVSAETVTANGAIGGI